MDRLTIPEQKPCCILASSMEDKRYCEELYTRLSDYEDTGMTPEEIEGVVENLFSVFSAGGALTLTDLANADWKSVQAISKKAGEIIKTQRKDG